LNYYNDPAAAIATAIATAIAAAIAVALISTSLTSLSSFQKRQEKYFVLQVALDSLDE
jgi:hypothetical protein